MTFFGRFLVKVSPVVSGNEIAKKCYLHRSAGASKATVGVSLSLFLSYFLQLARGDTLCEGPACSLRVLGFRTVLIFRCESL